MAKLYFKYGTMGSSKSLDLIRSNFNYKEGGKSTLILTPAIDNRCGTGKVASRVGVEADAVAFSDDDSLKDIVADNVFNNKQKFNAIFVDEAQFLTEEQVKELSYIVDYHDIDILAYGLKNTFDNKLFEGSHALLLYADKIEEIKSMCVVDKCNRKAGFNLRLSENGVPEFDGEQIKIGGNERYMPVCRTHYYEAFKNGSLNVRGDLDS